MRTQAGSTCTHTHTLSLSPPTDASFTPTRLGPIAHAGWIYVYAKSVAGLPDLAAEGLTSNYWLFFTLGRVAAVSE